MQSAGVCARECVFTGNGFSNELEGGKIAGMKAIQAKWYTNQFPYKRESMDGFSLRKSHWIFCSILNHIGRSLV